jgi:hypothetical protein
MAFNAYTVKTYRWLPLGGHGATYPPFPVLVMPEVPGEIFSAIELDVGGTLKNTQ